MFTGIIYWGQISSGLCVYFLSYYFERARGPVFSHNYDLGHVARKPVFGVSDKASFKQFSSATETS